MSIQNTFYLDVDIKRDNYVEEPKVTQNDDISFVLRLTDDGSDMEIENVSTYTLASLRPDGQSVLTAGTLTGPNEVTFEIGSTEISVPGRVKAAIQLYDVDGRVSSIPFTYEVTKDIATGYIPSKEEKTLIELVLGEGPAILAAAEAATITANDAAANADTKAALANAEAQSANSAAIYATDSGLLAEQKAALADASAVNADIATYNAENATQEAQDATDAINAVLPNVEGLENKGEYNNATTYVKNNLVERNGSSWQALQDTVGNPPPTLPTKSNAYWALVAQRGVDGMGSVVSVNGEGPDVNGNVTITIPDPDLSGLATKAELLEKVDKVPGKDLSTYDYDDIEKSEVSKIKIKADVSYVDTKVASIVSGSPKGTYSTLTALQTAFPTGNSNIYVVTADGKWYYWNSVSWVAGGIYQSTSVADKSISLSKLDDSLARSIKSIEVLESDPTNLWNGRMWLLSIPTIHFQETFTQTSGTQWDSLKWRPTVNNINPAHLSPSSVIDVIDNKGSIKIAANSDTETVAIQKVSQEKIIKTNEYKVLEFEISDYFEENTTIGGLTFGICPTIPSSSQYFFDEADWIRIVIGYEAVGRFILVQNKVAGNVSPNNYKETILSNAGLRRYRFVFFNQSHFKFERFNGLDWITLYENLNAGLTFTEAYVVIERSTYGSTAIRTSNIDNIIVKD
ncbi:BppU family phage baseplate upper protein [Psychrobacillus psychrodurans]|uniref:BppU family phage baseplate upper protein n=1 Tax=Psychrobacillus psychrodurans TaxID=126157 RepID=UPI001F4E1B84|nr:BppU family phage baseplate upper protein [Psychrobacillus psychrodurans]MCK1997962.1 BppU family phage baseplate upper protein [Psychrobacillus psychrodurans]